MDKHEADQTREYTQMWQAQQEFGSGGPVVIGSEEAIAMAELVLPKCYSCGEVGRKLQRCGKCRNPTVQYCGVECQQHNWPLHKRTCVSADFVSVKDGDELSKALDAGKNLIRLNCFLDATVTLPSHVHLLGGVGAGVREIKSSHSRRNRISRQRKIVCEKVHCE